MQPKRQRKTSQRVSVPIPIPVLEHSESVGLPPVGPPLLSRSREDARIPLAPFLYPYREDDEGDLARLPEPGGRTAYASYDEDQEAWNFPQEAAYDDRRSMVQEQDDAYEACVLADVQREIDAMEQRQLQRIKEESWYEQQELKACRVPLEPFLDEAAVRIQFRFHIEGGIDHRLVRRFPLKTTTAELFDYVESQPFLPVGTEVKVMTTFPMAELEPSGQTLQGVLGCAGRDWALNVEGTVLRI